VVIFSLCNMQIPYSSHNARKTVANLKKALKIKQSFCGTYDALTGRNDRRCKQQC
jgi:hypothetical protein